MSILLRCREFVSVCANSLMLYNQVILGGDKNPVKTLTRRHRTNHWQTGIEKNSNIRYSQPAQIHTSSYCFLSLWRDFIASWVINLVVVPIAPSEHVRRNDARLNFWRRWVRRTIGVYGRAIVCKKEKLEGYQKAGYVWERKRWKRNSPSGNWTRVTRVTGRYTDHYTNEDFISETLLTQLTTLHKLTRTHTHNTPIFQHHTLSP